MSDRDEAMTVLEMADHLEQQGNWQKAETFRLSVPPEHRKEYEAFRQK